MVRVAINGFGRIGRLVLRAGINNPNLEFVAVNDLGDPSILAQLLQRDSVHGKLKEEVIQYGDTLHVKNQDIKMLSEKDPSKLPWRDLDVDVVVESTGIFRHKEQAQAHLKAGAKKLLLSAPLKGDNSGTKTIVLGVNEHLYRGESIVSNASCTTNCFAPIAKVLNDNFGISSGVMTTIHGYTGDQRIVDAPHSDPRRAKAASLNIIPTTTGAAKAVMQVIPNLKGRLTASSIRVPVADGSLVSFVTDLNQQASAEEVNDLFLNVSKHHLKGILEYSEEPLVSTDILGNPHSCIFDSLLTRNVEGMLAVTGWYDNEWGYSHRMVDLISYVMNH